MESVFTKDLIRQYSWRGKKGSPSGNSKGRFKEQNGILRLLSSVLSYYNAKVIIEKKELTDLIKSFFLKSELELSNESRDSA